LDDSENYGEDRFILVGVFGRAAIDDRVPRTGEGIRIISARASPKNEEEGYYSQNPP
jgi:uncharacterized DUF497 family protein